MIPVETVIKKLIVDCEFVILPGFGALISRQSAASYDKETGVFSYPVKRLAFNESLKLDDGLLANYISRHEQITHAEAIRYIKLYTDRLWSVLEARGEARIDGIGRFSTNVEGKLVFDTDTEKYFRDEWYGFRNVKARLVDSKLTLTQGLAKPDVEQEADVIEINDSKRVRTNWFGWASAAILVGAVTYFSFVFVTGNYENKSTLNPFNNLFDSITPASPLPVVEQPNILVAEVDSNEFVQPIVDSSSAQLETAIEVAPEIKPAITEPIVSPGRFYVIAGAFKGKRQANVLLQQLKNKGFDQTVLLPADQHSSKVKVAVSSFEQENEAYAASKKLIDVIGEIGWVYELK